LSNSIGVAYRPSLLTSTDWSSERVDGDYPAAANLPAERGDRVAAMAARYQAGRDIWDGVPLRGSSRDDWNAWRTERAAPEPREAAEPLPCSPDGEVGNLWKMFLATL
jgi:hypothetical protein